MAFLLRALRVHKLPAGRDDGHKLCAKGLVSLLALHARKSGALVLSSKVEQLLCVGDSDAGPLDCWVEDDFRTRSVLTSQRHRNLPGGVQ
ncbi:hypothetical protein HBI56_183920 [Parastagonospora nodorum]|uniref:Uncharacterized protein n=2 Tax=Phaeosphaeria nodorum (strain SN15 / ATCC MYA-4574 / FGSC 10173) TaxID=321614 RepID=A0A7U2FD13_PHANO|nr:hypothetical protein SNOG_14188 [Parastagonospora nodorum SN15]KAH3907255.1 hypothetical protein HBH56_192390 [Parastagonospora nodorum]EAT78425.1 hypothetical protein SNOG_14188 [Parastagonospora nodorum SN15]KAH3937802.1 hypothetical protein HBH54_009580 [Parastagonospora nodorum]KAH3940699.1 hypothetical protein HBH53_212740 [Parastagonospora nodorum]KAH3966484.1 hypothetical protein HBH52_198540 [Parastagonospora nodorum]